MKTIARIRQLAKNHQVQLAKIGPNNSIAGAIWEDGPAFDNEREAELYARNIADSQMPKTTNAKAGRYGGKPRIRVYRAAFRGCRIRFA